MEYEKAKSELIAAWGTLGSSWGINRTMAMIHALLMISPEPLSTEEIMEELKISRGNANMNVRALMDWGLAEKRVKPGERREFFWSNKDIWQLARKVAEERKRRELDPILRVLNTVQGAEGTGTEVETFNAVTKEMLTFASQSEMVLETFAKSKSNWLIKILGFITRK